MAIKYESTFPSEADGLLISVLALIPVEQPYRGIVQLVHGMCEYKERYLPFMEYLAEQGFVSVIHDQRGHGKSVRDTGDYGYLYGGGSAAILMDIQTVNRDIRERFPGIPLILFGHSMGSLAVRAFTRKYDDLIDMLVLSGTPYDNPGRGLGEAVAKAESKMFGPEHRSKALTVMSFAAFQNKFRKENLQNSWISSDPEVVKAYNDSELCGFLFSDDGYLTLFELMKEAYDAKHYACTNPLLPVLFISGSDDPCLGDVRKFAKAVQKMRQAGYLDVKGKLYPGMRHEILNETGHEKVYRDVVWYIRKKLHI